MKKIFAAMLVGVTLLMAAPQASADYPDIPIPLNYPVPFPWNSIEGVWEAKGPGFRWLFSFEVQNDASFGKILKIIHVDTQTREIMGSGTGLSVQDSFEVSGAMVASGYQYQLFVGLYRTDDNPNSPKMTILTLRSFTHPEQPDTKVVIQKIAPLPLQAPKKSTSTNNELSKMPGPL